MRKVLSFVLVLALVLSSFSMAFAADGGLSDVAGNANEDAIQVAYDLSIITGNPDGTFQPDKAVNRAEFAAMLTRALAIPDSALAGYTTTSFKDTVGYGWAVPYLAFCQSKGIMLGDGAGNAMPGRTITVNEAVTMALRAIGYTANSALLVGAWPANYVSIAQNEDLYEDVATDTTVNKASAAQIIYNLLTVQKVAVNTDGETTFQTTRSGGATVEANLLNTNLGCEAEDDVILGVDYDYDNSLINITGKIGAFGTAYTNDDGDLVAFTVDSTALTGKIDGTKFKVGDDKYDFGTGFTTDTAVFANTVAKTTNGAFTVANIGSLASAYADGGKTVTLNVDLSGKKIKDVYSLVAWKADQAALAASDVQEDIADDELLGEDFALDDDDNIEMKGFQLVGVASLEDIEEDNVVYVYTDGDDIRKVAVGTETVEGIVEEVGDDFALIEGEEYNFSNVYNALAISDVDVDDEGIFYLDSAGKIYDFEGTTGKADTFAIVKAYDDGSNIDNARLKLYLSDDSTKTLDFADEIADLDWTTSTDPAVVTSTAGGLTAGALIGYAVDSDGDIDTIDISAVSASALDFQSTKVIKVNNVSKSVASGAVVFTYDDDYQTTSKYDVAALADVKKGSIHSVTQPAFVVLNDDGKVAALFIEEEFVDAADDDVYGVFNERTNAKTGDDEVYKFTGFIDGTAFTKKTDDRSGFNGLAGVFGVYKITVDSNDVITKVVALGSAPVVDKSSGIIADDKVISSISSDRTVITDTAGDKYTIADDAVVYLYDDSDDEFSVSKLSSLRKGYTVSLYDTKGDDADGIASVVIYIED